MEINKQQLQNALAIVKPGLAKKEKIEQSTSFAFLKKRVVTFNDEISLSHPVTGLDIEGAVETDKLYQLLSKIKKETINLEVNGNQILVTSGRTKAGLILQNEVKLPLDEGVNKKGSWKELPEKFVEYIQFCIPCCSRVLTRPILNCVHVSPEGIIEASDGHRIIQCDLKEEIPVNDFLIPHFNAIHIVKLNPSYISEGKGWIHFKTKDKTILSCRIQDDEFPETTPHLQAEGNRIIFPLTISDALDRANVFSMDEESSIDSITIHIENKRLTISSKSETGWFEESLNIKYTGEPIGFSITPNLLKDIVNRTRECILDKKGNKLVFRGEGWTYMTTLRG